MKCENCKVNDACYHSTIIINGQKASTHLCEQCAEKQGLISRNRKFGFESLFDFFGDILPYNNYNFDTPELDYETEPVNENYNDVDSQSKEVENLIDLRMQLQKAIDEERYEDAGEINKKIKKWEHKGD